MKTFAEHQAYLRRVNEFNKTKGHDKKTDKLVKGHKTSIGDKVKGWGEHLQKKMDAPLPHGAKGKALDHAKK